MKVNNPKHFQLRRDSSFGPLLGDIPVNEVMITPHLLHQGEGVIVFGLCALVVASFGARRALRSEKEQPRPEDAENFSSEGKT
jgi:hypothetical protein